MLINIPEGDVPTTTAKLLTALTGVACTVHGTDGTTVDVVVIRGEDRLHEEPKLLCHPWREDASGTWAVDEGTTLTIPCNLITTLEVL